MAWDTVLLLISFTIPTVLSIKPEIVDEIKPVVAAQHSVARLNCTVVNTNIESKPNIVQWTKVKGADGTPVKLSEDNKIVFDNNQQDTAGTGLPKYDILQEYDPNDDSRIKYSLGIRRLSENDSGKYQCTIVMTGLHWDEWKYKIGELLVLVPPTITPSGDNELTKNPGENATLECTSSGYPSPNITWKREDGKRLPNGSFRHNGPNVTLSNLQIRDRGNYLCVADNNVKPPDSYKIRINLNFPPVSSAVQDSVGQAQNRRFSAKLECIVSGYPAPNIIWYKLTKEGMLTIKDDDKYDIVKLNTNLKSDQMWYTLTVKNVQANDFTKYYCVGRNRWGEGQVIITLFETSECQGANCPSIGTGAAAQHTSTFLSFVLAFVAMGFIKKWC